jgi:hypothetical protein
MWLRLKVERDAYEAMVAEAVSRVNTLVAVPERS